MEIRALPGRFISTYDPKIYFDEELSFRRYIFLIIFLGTMPMYTFLNKRI